MDLGLQNTVVLITGGSKGIGLACARSFAAEGARVAIASRSAENLSRAEATLRSEGVAVIGVAADLREPQQAAAMVRSVEAQLGPVGVLVNSAGAALRTPPDELTAAHWHAAMDANDRMQEGFAADARRSGQSIEAIREQRLRAMPLGRLGQPEDVADMVVFLASRRASYVSGAVVSLDGAATPMVV